MSEETIHITKQDLGGASCLFTDEDWKTYEKLQYGCGLNYSEKKELINRIDSLFPSLKYPDIYIIGSKKELTDGLKTLNEEFILKHIEYLTNKYIELEEERRKIEKEFNELRKLYRFKNKKQFEEREDKILKLRNN